MTPVATPAEQLTVRAEERGTDRDAAFLGADPGLLRGDRETNYVIQSADPAALPHARFVEWPDGGHLAAYYREREMLDELLSR